MPAETRNAAATTKTRQRSGGHPTLALLGISLFFVGGVAIYSVVYFGYVEGQEFAPESFTRREFSYYEIPVVGLQISPIERSDVTNDLEQHLVSQSLIPIPKKAPNQRWDLVMARRGAVRSSRKVIHQGEARILCEYLDAEDGEDENVWLQWSKDHSVLAKTLWPMVARLAREELYIFMPDLFEIARHASDPKKLQNDLHRLLADKYLAFGRVQQMLGKHDAAIELLSEGLVHSPGNSQLLLARSKSWETLGKPEKAAEDLAQAQHLEQP